MLVALVCVPIGSIAQSDSFDFKGIALGSDFAAFQNDPNYFCVSGWTPDSDQTCLAEEGKEGTIANIPVRSFMVQFYDQKLHAISIAFDQGNYAQVQGALTEKHGKSLSNDHYEARKPGAYIIAKPGTDRRFASVRYSTLYYDEEYKRRKDAAAKTRAKSGAKDL